MKLLLGGGIAEEDNTVLSLFVVLQNFSPFRNKITFITGKGLTLVY